MRDSGLTSEEVREVIDIAASLIKKYPEDKVYIEKHMAVVQRQWPNFTYLPYFERLKEYVNERL